LSLYNITARTSTSKETLKGEQEIQIFLYIVLCHHDTNCVNIKAHTVYDLVYFRSVAVAGLT